MAMVLSALDNGERSTGMVVNRKRRTGTFPVRLFLFVVSEEPYNVPFVEGRSLPVTATAIFME